ncbi:MAG TPA: Calx-beta domain-containing protein [Thermoanaerobaculia bacterium]|nr:Calx-beta domain-containing protein [Thermoanaerobaculia bacterium]
MSNTARLLLVLVGVLSGGPAAAQIELFAELTEIPVTADTFLSANQPSPNLYPECENVAESEWSITAGADANIVVGGYFEGEGIEWVIDWATGGTKTINVSIARVGCDVTGTIDIAVNSCRFVQPTYQGFEGDGVIEVALERFGGSAGTLDCSLDAVGGTATPDVDYFATKQGFQWQEGDDSNRIYVIELEDDDVAEPTETIELELTPLSNFAPIKSPPSATRIGSPVHGFIPAQATVFILDDDGSVLSFLTSGSQALETAGTVSIGVLRSGDTTGSVSVGVTVVAGAATEGLDYTLPDPPTLNWANGEGGVKTFDVELIADDVAEPDEGVLLALVDASVTPSTLPAPVIGEPSTHLLTIIDVPSSGRLRFTEEAFTAAEGDGTVEIAVLREGGTAGAVSVDVCLGEGTAGPDDLTVPSTTTLTWAAGEAGERLLELGVVDDFEIEGIETLALELCALTGDAMLGEPSVAILTILDNDFSTSEEILVAGPAGSPEDPIVVYDRSGRKIVVWVADDGDGLGVFAQLYDQDGSPIGGPFRVNQDTAGDSSQPSATILDDGTIVIVWRDALPDGARDGEGRLAAGAAQGSSIAAKGFNPNGTANGQQTVVSTGEAGDSQNPEVGADKDGELVITWQDGGKVKGKLLDQGLGPKTPVIDVSELVGAAQPEVAVSASGDFVVVWQQPPGAPGAASAQGGTIVARTFTEQGTPKGEAQTVTENAQAASPAVAIDDAGNFFVAFSEPGVEDLDVFGRLFDRRGKRKGPKVRINQRVAGDQVKPRVDMNSIGDIAVVWQTDPVGAPGASSTEGTSVVARGFNPQGQPQTGDIEVATTEAASTPQNPDVSIQDEDQVTVVFEKKGPGEVSEGIFQKVIDTSLFSGPCFDDETTLCASDDARFRVLVEWQDFAGNEGEGQAVPLTGDSGYFWFFGADNVELLVKVLDGCAINDRVWVFAGGLTNVEVNLRVDDTAAGITVSYFNSLGRSFQPILDADAFATCDAAAPGSAAAPIASIEGLGEGSRGVGVLHRAASAACAGADTTLCLRDDRFEATLLWESASASGVGQPVALSDETGSFWFFEPDNVEAVVKVLDGCALNGHYWVFAAGVTDVATDLQVLDTVASVSRSYTSPLGTPFAPILDVEAFECP